MDLVAYIRVSKVGGREGDSFQSPQQQRKAIEAIVALTPGARIVSELEDLDESGGTMDRPGVKGAIAMVESGQADGIVCAYLDRWARTVEALEMIEGWAKRGKTFISARERFDATTSQGKFALGMMLLVAKYYRDQMTERWDESVAGAISRGVHTTIPYGYRRSNGKGSPLVIEPSEAEIVQRIYAQRAQGYGAAAITEALNSDGIPSPRGGLWTRQSIRALLRVRTYAGVAHKGSHELTDAHPAIIPPSEWEAVQRERGQSPVRGDNLLSGLVRCRGCGYSMGAQSSQGSHRFNCGRHHAHMRCPSPTTAPASKLQQMVTDAFLARYGKMRMQGGSASNPAVASTEAVLQCARVEYQTWRDDAEMRTILGDSDYRAGLVARKQAVTDAERAYGEAIRDTKADMLIVDEAVWRTLDTAERRELMRSGIDSVVLSRAASTHTPLVDRVEIVWAGELDHDGTASGIAAAVRERP